MKLPLFTYTPPAFPFDATQRVNVVLFVSLPVMVRELSLQSDASTTAAEPEEEVMFVKEQDVSVREEEEEEEVVMQRREVEMVMEEEEEEGWIETDERERIPAL